MRGTALAFIRTELPHVACGHTDLQPLAELLDAKETQCRYCGGTIDLTEPKLQERLKEEAEIYQEIKVLKMVS